MSTLKNFFNFIREQGVVGLAVGFILGGAVTKVVTSLVTDIINPIIGIALGATKNLTEISLHLAGSTVHIGNFLNNIIDFSIISAVVYIGVKLIGIDRLDKKKE